MMKGRGVLHIEQYGELLFSEITCIEKACKKPTTYVI